MLGFGLYYVPEDFFRKLGVGLNHDPYDPEKCHTLEETHHSHTNPIPVKSKPLPTTLLQLHGSSHLISCLVTHVASLGGPPKQLVSLLMSHEVDDFGLDVLGNPAHMIP